MKILFLFLVMFIFTPVYAQELSFDDQLVDSEKYSKIIDRLHTLENENTKLENQIQNFQNNITSNLSEINYSLIQSGDIANKSLWLGLYISIGFAALAIAATIIYAHKLGSQTKLIERDVKTRIRPILNRKELRKTITNYDEQNVGELHTLTRQKVLFHFHNTGTLPALKMSKNYYSEIREMPFNGIKLDPQNYEHIDKMPSLAPNEYYSVDILWNNLCFDEAVNGKKCYFGLIIWYHDQNDTRYYYHMEGYFDKTDLLEPSLVTEIGRTVVWNQYWFGYWEKNELEGLSKGGSQKYVAVESVRSCVLNIYFDELYTEFRAYRMDWGWIVEVEKVFGKDNRKDYVIYRAGSKGKLKIVPFILREDAKNVTIFDRFNEEKRTKMAEVLEELLGEEPWKSVVRERFGGMAKEKGLSVLVGNYKEDFPWRYIVWDIPGERKYYGELLFDVRNGSFLGGDLFQPFGDNETAVLRKERFVDRLVKRIRSNGEQLRVGGQ